MKIILPFLLLLCALCVLPSCVVTDPYYGGGYSGGYDSGEYYSSPAYSSTSIYTGSSYGYGRGYSRPVYNVCRVCGHNPCSCRSTSHYSRPTSHYSRPVYNVCRTCGHNPCTCRSSSRYIAPRNDHRDDHRDRDEQRIRLNTKKDDMPKGWHSKEWYEKRDIDVHRYNYERKDGSKHKKH